MTTIPKPHVGDAGTPIRVLFELPNGQAWDISTATEIKITHTAPDGTQTVHTGPAGDADFTTDGSDGLAEYVTDADFWDQDGDWQVQGYAKLADGKERRTEVGIYPVYP